MEEKKTLQNNLQSEINQQIKVDVVVTEPPVTPVSQNPTPAQPVVENIPQETIAEVKIETPIIQSTPPVQPVPVNTPPVIAPIIKPVTTMPKGPGTPEPTLEKIPPVVPEVKPEASNTPADSYQISSVRTYKGDVSNTVQSDKINTAKILIAEQKQKEKNENKVNKYSIENGTNKFKLAVSFILIGVAVVGIFYGTTTYLLPKQKIEQNHILNNSNNIFVIDNQATYDVLGQNTEAIKDSVQEFLNHDFQEATINELILFRKNIETKEDIKKLPVSSVFDLIGIAAPSIFDRSLGQDYVLGVYRSGSQNNPFILLEISDFANAYDSIFDYEAKIVREMKDYFGGFKEFDLLEGLKAERIKLLPGAEITNSTSTATTTEKIKQEEVLEVVIVEDSASTTASTTPQTSEEKLLKIEAEMAKLEKINKSYQRFIDVVLQNTDSRAVVGNDSNVLFYYTFIDNEWLLFADNIETLKEVKRRIRERNLVR